MKIDSCDHDNFIVVYLQNPRGGTPCPYCTLSEEAEDYKKLQAENEGYKECEVEVKRLTKEISYILTPDGKGPTQPSLCDVVAYVRDDFEQLRAENERLKDKIAELRFKIDELQAMKGGEK